MKLRGFGMKWLIFATTCVAALFCNAYGAVKVDVLFSDNAVLQQGMSVPVWGTAASGEQIIVEFAGQKKSAPAGADGKWMVTLDAMPASAVPRILKISGGAISLVATNVVVGEVWVGSGQSNMEVPVRGYTSAGSLNFEKNDPALAKMIQEGPYPNLRFAKTREKWQESTPEAIRQYSALLFAFSQPLQRELNVPVGLLVGAVGGMPSGAWVSQEAIDKDAVCQEVIAKYAKTYDFDAEMKKFTEASGAKTNAGAQAPGQKVVLYEPLHAGEIRAKPMGRLYDRHIRPYIPYAIRGVLWDQGESGTRVQGLDQYTLMGALIRGWRKDWGQGDFPFLYVQKPSGGGIAWDANDPMTAKAGQLSSLPRNGPPPLDPDRDCFTRMMKYPNTFMVISSDLGGGVHPVYKSSYGARACRVALGAVYGKPVEYYGPVYNSHEIKGGKIIIHFTHVGKGLAVRRETQNGEKLQGFSIAGEDKNFVWADAVIEGETVVVSSAKIANPVAVRYACAAACAWANLFNQDGLPALSFHTDDVPLAFTM